MVNGIIVSTAGEADLLLMKLDRRETLTLQHKPFFRGMLNGRTSAVICICGVGKANAAHGATLLLERFRPGHVYNIGVGGAYPGSGLSIGDVAVAENEFYGDEGLITESGFHTIDVLGLPLASVNGANYYNKFPMFVQEAFAAGLQKGNFVSVSACTGTRARALEIEFRFNAICENMEGAAIAHICVLNSVPVSEIRGISNIAGDRDTKPLETADVRIASEKVQQLLLENI